MNKVFLIGNLTRDPEAGTTANGIAYCRFSIAVNRRFSKEQNEVDFFNIVTWRALAENCGKLLAKGRKVAITGSIQIRNYEANDGSKRTSVDIVAEEVEFLTPSNRAEGESGNAPAKKVNDITELTPADESELPF